MYIYEPGAGCSGDSRHVEPGDSDIFSGLQPFNSQNVPIKETEVKFQNMDADTCRRRSYVLTVSLFIMINWRIWGIKIFLQRQ